MDIQYYHATWEESDTKQNFFRWLDHGEGRELSLPECSREQLEKERITYVVLSSRSSDRFELTARLHRYLSAEQRLNYHVVIDRETGKLKWFKSGEWVDTT